MSGGFFLLLAIHLLVKVVECLVAGSGERFERIEVPPRRVASGSVYDALDRRTTRLLSAGRYRKALRTLERHRRRFDLRAPAYLQMAVAHHHLGRELEARRALFNAASRCEGEEQVAILSHGLALCPDDPLVGLALAQAYARVGQIPRATFQVERVLQLSEVRGDQQLQRRALQKLQLIDPFHPRVRPQPRTPIRNPQMEACLLQDPGDAAARLVYADWLSDQGDPRGELIAVGHRYEETGGPLLRARMRTLQHRQLEQYLGGFARRVDPHWRVGFIERVHVRTFLNDEEVPVILGALAKMPDALLMQGLALDGGANPGTVVQALEQTRMPEALDTLALGVGWRQSWEWRDVTRILTALPRLQELTVYADVREAPDRPGDAAPLVVRRGAGSRPATATRTRS